MKLSHEKIVHLSHIVVESLQKADGVQLSLDKNQVRLRIVDLLRADLRREAEIEQRARGKVMAQKRSIPEGSQEWDVLFRKYYEEELDKVRSVGG